jgi:hypothetical protein
VIGSYLRYLGRASVKWNSRPVEAPRGWKEFAVIGLGSLAIACELANFFFATPVMGQQEAEQSNMRLVGYNDLQGRASYMPIIKKQGNRWIAYIGAQDGKPPEFNPLTGRLEPGGTSVVDVTDPSNPKFLAHIPGEMDRTDKVPTQEAIGKATALDVGGSQYMRVCTGQELPHADPKTVYMLRAFGRIGWEMWNVTDPSKPNRLSVIRYDSLNTHRLWWECDTGIAYLIGGPFDWKLPSADKRFDAYDHALIYDLSDPTKPIFIRSFGLPGQEPGTASPAPPVGLHTILSTGPKGNRVYFANGNAGNGIFEIVDRDKLLHGPKEPTDDNLRYPVIARVDLPADTGVHTIFPLTGMQLPEFAQQKDGGAKDFLAITGQGHNDNKECHESRQMLHVFDVSTESKPLGVSTWTVPEASGDFCERGAVFGTHATNDNRTPIYYNRVLFVAFHNAGVRAVDIRDPYQPKEIGYYIPAVNKNTQESCYGKDSDRHCKVAIDTNNVEVDDRGYIYTVDFAGTGMHILELTGAARQVADFTKAGGSPGPAEQ